VIYAFRWRFDSDEWQHLHVAWAWSQGFLEYRDLFDNHAPLFHMLTAPLVAAFGETPVILFLMRLVMLPLTLATLAASAVISRGVSGLRAALWTPVVLAPVPVFFFRSIEYRADGLWAAFLTGAIAVMVAGTAGPARAFAAGLLLGLAIVTSLKSVLLIFALAVAVLLLPCAVGRSRRGAPTRRRLRLLPPLIGGTVLPPLALLLYFARRGAVQALIDDTIWRNILPGLGTWAAPWRRLLFLPETAVILGLAAWVARRQRPPRAARRVAFLVLTAGTFLTALQTLWPLYTTYDLLVFYPLLLSLVVGSMLASGDARATIGVERVRAQAWRFPAIAALLLGCVTLEIAAQDEDTSYERALLAEVLRLTDPSDLVLDQKGDAIFRRRPTPDIMERVTGDRLERGLLPEHIQEDVVATGTCVAAARIPLFPARTRRFLTENFLPIGHLLVAGRFLPVPGTEADHSGQFDIAVPARYVLVAESGDVQGMLDGEPYTGPRELTAGRHTFSLSFKGPRAAVVWAKAVLRGFSPFDESRSSPNRPPPIRPSSW